MTAISITPANVVAGTDAVKEQGIAGATITAGQAVYKEASTGKFKLADADSGTAEVRNVYGIALHGASDNQPLMVQRSGEITIGGTLTVGEIYVLDTGPGGIAPEGDLASGEYVSVIGVARTAAILRMGIINSTVAVPA